MPLLKVDAITGGYGDTEVLRHVSITVEQHEIVSIVGPNGAGKSTLMKTVFGLLHPREGSITFADHDISQLAAHQIVKLGMCYVPQVANVFTSLTVEENLEMGAYALKNGDLEACKQRVYDMFPQLKPRRRQLAGKMSGGERQMVAMGSALMLNPKLLLLDEPTAALSPKLVSEIFERIAHINETGVGIMMVEQNARQSLQMAHRGYVLASGENRHEGTGRALLEDPNVGRLYLGG
ncbi:ABC transporter ATP-binding protein [Paralcaligenes ureilyticus]|uniref:Branched-chain amino acid transport system ATP-binding protein/neutral amino acid transport system ATP-binding protein n=1 Tax=Paralcaligenes ureilyticus TaxID=627131 RepID=A0A4V2UXB0_9BURK|nr:ABC transporter ATP-binding protein [Paralcaligenes ureilyticus]TCT02788.1 branched-chain amino acid transport system ATP-binding protein/neutral amino acid transport system ATP-binding protein [Paralcaligenes ureilyticus]